jgi:hypothetical protein
MDDPRPAGVPASGDVVCEEPVDERPGAMAGRGVYDDSGRLVDDEQVLVLPDNAQVEILGLEGAWLTLRRLELDRLSSREPVALRAPRTVDQHLARVEQPFGGRARADVVESPEKAVEPLAGRLGRHDESSSRHLPARPV